tara:strand:+ start:406 stop:693 length:288 start_codon:yes stop_codon:yes gene_type:complete
MVIRLLTAAGKLILTYSKKRADDILKKGGKKITQKESDKITGLTARRPKKEFTALPSNPKKTKREARTGEFKKGGIVKRYKGGLMVKPKAAKRGY